MKSAMILAALCAALCASAPVTVQAATTLTDHDLYCSVIPLTKKCDMPAATAMPAKAAAMPAKPAPMKVAMAKPAAPMKPAAAPAPAPTASMMMGPCTPAPAGSAFLFVCK